MRVSLYDKLDEILILLKGGRNYESMQAGSDFIAVNKWPSGLVVVRNKAAQTIGMGFLVRACGKLCLGTAAHVALKCKDGFILSGPITNHVSVQIDDAMVVLTTNLDFTLIQVPENTASKLGVAKVKLGKTPTENAAVNVYGFVNGRLCQSFGVMGSTTRNLGFKHSMSTLNGFSGTPIFRDGCVVGVHSRSDGMGYNYGLSLDFLLDSLKTSEFESGDYDSDRYAYHREEDLDYDDEEDFDVLTWKWEGKQQRFARADSEGWAEFDAEEEALSRFHRKDGRLAGIDWHDDAPMDFDAPVWEQAVNFRLRPSNGAQTSSNGKHVKGKQLETCSNAESTTSTPPDLKETKEARPKKSKRKSKLSKAGNGPQEPRKQSDSVSSSTETDSSLDNGNRTKKDSNGSEPKSLDSTQKPTPPVGSRALRKRIRQIKSAKLVMAQLNKLETVAILDTELKHSLRELALLQTLSVESEPLSKKIL